MPALRCYLYWPRSSSSPAVVFDLATAKLTGTGEGAFAQATNIADDPARVFISVYSGEIVSYGRAGGDMWITPTRGIYRLAR